MKTALSPEQAREVLRQYNLKLREHAPLPRGTINSNYVLDTDAGPLFLRINEGKSDADAAFEAALIWHLGSHGVPTPALWRTRTGGASVPLPGEPGTPRQPVMLLAWVDGHEKLDSEIDEKSARCVGELLAQMHLATRSFKPKRPGIYTLRHIAQRIVKVNADSRARADLGATLDELQGEAQRLQAARRRDLPTGIGHGDLFPDNFLFTRKHDGGVILDLEQAATIPLVYDLAVALLAFCAPIAVAMEDGQDVDQLGALRLSTARALVAGYQSLRALSMNEKLGLYEELRYAALRFTVTRLTDVHGYGHGDPSPLPPEKAPDGETIDGSAKLPRALRRSRPLHSKDHRDFLRRLHDLQSTDAESLCNGLT